MPIEQTAAAPQGVEVRYHRTYYVGAIGKDRRTERPVSIQQPPHYGYGHGFVIDAGKTSRRGGKRQVTLLCPFTLDAYTIPADAYELCEEEPLDDERALKLCGTIAEKWDDYMRLKLQKDYGVAAMVLTHFGHPVPVMRMDEDGEGIEERRPRGKEAGTEGLTKRVRRETRRGEVLALLLGGVTSVHEAMARTSMTRSGVLTHLHALRVEHGIGYRLQGSEVHIVLPEGCTDPFEAEQVTRPTRPAVDGATPSDPGVGTSKPVDLDRYREPKEGTKRAAVAALLLAGWRSVAEVAVEVGCTEASAKSHAFDLHRHNGFGVQFSPDGSRARVLRPDLLA